ncbi:MAG: GIN domain-containing protein [Bacteroidia bacterium]
MKRILSFSLLLLAITFLSCRNDQDDYVPNGIIVTDQRPITADIHKILLTGSGDVTIFESDTARLELIGSSNIVSFIETTMQGDALIIHPPNRQNPFINSDVKVRVYLPDVREVASEGGNCQMRFENCHFPRLILEVNGNGAINHNNSSCEVLETEIVGSGFVRMAVSDTLNATLIGSGKVRYAGNPVVSKVIEGNGTVEQE